jgi:hypothetical protein
VVRALKTRRLEKTDVRLLSIMGFTDVLKILSSRKEIEREAEEVAEDDPAHEL